MLTPKDCCVAHNRAVGLAHTIIVACCVGLDLNISFEKKTVAHSPSHGFSSLAEEVDRLELGAGEPALSVLCR